MDEYEICIDNLIIYCIIIKGTAFRHALFIIIVFGGIMAKYIFVTGGVVSSLGKGIVAASIGVLLKSRGLKITIQSLTRI